jgi:cation transport ATPase
MAEDKKEPWLNYLALTTIIFAVAATLSTFKGGGYSTRSMLSQEQASNKWSYFQSKSLKLYLYETQKDVLELDTKRIPASDKETLKAYQKKIADYELSVKRYEKEKAEIQNDAKKFETQRDEAQKHSQAFGMAVIFLQISILLSSIAALIKRKYLWYLAMGVGAVGLFYFLNGFLLFLN